MAESEELLKAKELKLKLKQQQLTSHFSQSSAELDQQQRQSEAEEKVCPKTGLEDDKDKDDGDEWSSCTSCSDRSFDTVNTDSNININNIEIRARSNSVGSQTSSMQSESGIKKRRKRRQKGGSRHRRHQNYQFGKDIHVALGQKALYLKEKDKAAALRRLEDETGLVTTPAAPFNSSQYLMGEFAKDFPPIPFDSSRSASNSPPDRNNPAPLTPFECNQEVIHCVKEDQEFAESLISAQAESLQSLPKAELVKNFISLEEKVADLHKQIAQGEHQQEEQNEGDLYSPEYGLDNDPYVCESVYNSETGSLSSNNEEYVDLSGANHQSECVDESSDDKVTSSGYVDPCEVNHQPVCVDESNDDTVPSPGYDLSEVNHQPVCVDESNDDTVTSSGYVDPCEVNHQLVCVDESSDDTVSYPNTNSYSPGYSS